MRAAARPTAIEASFLALEREGLPMHVAALLIFDGQRPVTMAELKQLVSTRLRRLPRFGQRAHTLSGGRGFRWVPVDRIHYASHLIHHELPPCSGRSQLHDLCARLHEQPLDRALPLWQMHLIDGLAGDRQALLIKTHHAVADGLAGVEIAVRLFDPAPGTPPPPLPAMRFVEPQKPSLFGALQDFVGIGYTVAGGPLALDGPFNGTVGAQRSFGAATMRLETIKRVKRQLGGSIDDVVVAAVAAGIRRYLRDVAYPEIPKALRAMLPVSTRLSTHPENLGNHVSAVFVDLPMEFDGLPEIVRRIAASKATLRTAHSATGNAFLVAAAGQLPPPLHGALLRLVSEMPFANLVLSDVPGPHAPLFLLGRRIHACYPMMPLAPRVGLSIATMSISGTMGLGVTADPGLVPEPQRLASAIERILREFEHTTFRAA